MNTINLNTADHEQSLLTFEELLMAVRGKNVGFARSSQCCFFTSVTTDSRMVVPGSLFIPLYGEKQDGHNYIPQAIQNGATIIFVANDSYEKNENQYMKLASEKKDLSFIVVQDTLNALQNAAAAYVRKFPQLIRVSITGSSGKTTTKEITAALLSQKYSVISNKGNLNSETGLPLSVFTIRPEHDVALFEMGMNRLNEIGELATVFRPQYAAITNIGTAHIGKLGSRSAIAQEKKKIFSYLEKDGVAVIPAEDDFASFLAEGVRGKIIYYGNDVPESGVHFLSDDGLLGTTFSVDNIVTHLHLPGRYNFADAQAAIALAKSLGVSPEQICAGIERVAPIFGRSQIVNGRLTVLQDCYNANPDSMNRAIEFFTTVPHKGKKIIVLGDMLELGEDSESAHSFVGPLALDSGAELILFIGKEMHAAYTAAEQNLSNRAVRLIFIEDHDDEAIASAAKTILSFADPGDIVLLKASRGMGLERLTPLLTGGVDE